MRGLGLQELVKTLPWRTQSVLHVFPPGFDATYKRVMDYYLGR
jgi:hypothetical protein